MKKTILYSLILIMSVGQIRAQLPKWALDLGKRSELVDSEIAPLISYIDALQPALSIIRQQYRLERNGDFFGRKNKQYFAETYSLGIKISGATILYRRVVLPWENNADYRRINSSGKYKPEYFKSMQRPIIGNEWNSIDLELGSQYVSPFSSDSLLYRHTDATADFGLPVDETPGIKQGYLIWVYSTTDLQDSAMQVKFRQTELQIEAKADGSSIGVMSDSVTNILGGFFVVPQVERAGYIKLLLVGVAVKTNQNEWVLNLMTRKTRELTTVAVPDNADKSPKRKKREKTETTSVENTDDEELTPIK